MAADLPDQEDFSVGWEEENKKEISLAVSVYLRITGVEIRAEDILTFCRQVVLDDMRVRESESEREREE